jgi:hypothetical protein
MDGLQKRNILLPLNKTSVLDITDASMSFHQLRISVRLFLYFFDNPPARSPARLPACLPACLLQESTTVSSYTAQMVGQHLEMMCKKDVVA